MDMYTFAGQQALIGMISHIFFIVITFYALQGLMLEKLFKKNHTFQIQLFYILISIAIGSTVSNFFINISSWSQQLPYLF